MSSTPGLDVTAPIHIASELALERMVTAVEAVRERLERAAAALEARNVPYAVICGNAVGLWVMEIEPDAARNTVDVDILIRRSDLEAAKVAMAAAGFVYRHAAGMDMFLDGPNGRASSAVHVIFANEKIRQEYLLPAPDLTENSKKQSVRVLGLESLVTMKLTSNRDKDRTHVRDLIGVNLVDESWLTRLPAELAQRLKSILDTPHG